MALLQNSRQSLYLSLHLLVFVSPNALMSVHSTRSLATKLAGLESAILQVPLAILTQGQAYADYGFYFESKSSQMFPLESACRVGNIESGSGDSNDNGATCQIPSNARLSIIFVILYFLILFGIVYHTIDLLLMLIFKRTKLVVRGREGYFSTLSY